MVQRNGFSVFSLALIVAFATPPALVTILTAEPSRLLAQTSEPSPVPTPFAVPEGSLVRIDGSESLEAVNEELKQRYETSFEGTEVNLQTNGTPAALQALRDGTIDIASIGRPLTEAEAAEGLQAIALPREKIAIIIGSDNPFNSNLTFEQFAQIFRGDITDWSELGGEPGPIRLVDRAAESDTRTALSQYEVWNHLGGFVPGATVEQLAEDSTDAVVAALGSDGIGYATYSQVRDRSDVTIIPMHQTLPDDPAYPYSQPRTLVHRGELNPPVAAFVALASGAEVVAATADPAAADPAAATTTGAEDPAVATGDVDAAVAQADDAAIVASETGEATDEAIAEDGAAADTTGNGDWLPWLALLLLPLLPFMLKLFRGGAPSSAQAPTTPEGGVSARAADVLGGRGVAGGGATPTMGSALNAPGAVGGAAIAGMAAAAGAGAIAGGDRPSSRIVLAPRNGSTGYAYWEAPSAHRQALMDQGGRDMKLRIYDVTDISQPETADLSHLAPQRLHQLDVGEADQDAHLILERDRVYLTEIGYETGDGHWLTLARSNKIRLDEASGLTATANGATNAMGAAALGLAGTTIAGVAGVAGAAAVAERRSQPTSRIVLSPHNNSTGHAYWEAPTAHRDDLKRQGGQTLMLRVYDVTAVASPETADLSGLAAERVHQLRVEESDQEAYVSLVRDRDYLTEIGYETGDGRWLSLARSNTIRLSGTVGLAPDIAEAGVPSIGAAAAVAGAALAGGAIAQGLQPEGDNTVDEQSTVEAAKYDVGQTDLSGERLADVDDNLPGLPEGYGQSRILLLPRDPQWAYAYWDTPNDHKEELRHQGGQRLALRLYDVTDIADIRQQRPHSLVEYECDELARDWYLRIPVSDRDYIAEIGYITADGRWLMLARSNPVRIPPIYPSDWYEENFISVDWSSNLAGQTFYKLMSPGISTTEDLPLYSRMYDMAEAAEAERVAGSLFGSMQQVPGSLFGSQQMASGQAFETMESGKAFETMESGKAFETMQMTSGQAFETMTSGRAFETMTSGRAFETLQMASGQALTSLEMGWGQAPTASGRAFETFPFGSVSSYITASGMGMSVMRGWGVPESRMIEEERSMSGVGMSGIGFFSSMPPIRARKFWLVADAELIVYGATEPDATVFVNGNPIQLEPDGTFRFHMPFPDGLIDFPILAVAADGEQTRAIHMKFERETPYRRTNTKDDAQDEAY